MFILYLIISNNVSNEAFSIKNETISYRTIKNNSNRWVNDTVLISKVCSLKLNGSIFNRKYLLGWKAVNIKTKTEIYIFILSFKSPENIYGISSPHVIQRNEKGVYDNLDLDVNQTKKTEDYKKIITCIEN